MLIADHTEANYVMGLHYKTCRMEIFDSVCFYLELQHTIKSSRESSNSLIYLNIHVRLFNKTKADNYEIHDHDQLPYLNTPFIRKNSDRIIDRNTRN